jgi:(5-formylfuran-3-yl)methyl phosphate synthase
MSKQAPSLNVRMSARRTGLLVSVRSAVETELALEGGADVIDVKEPRNGALGAADPSVWREVLRVVRGQATTSAALGDLPNDPVADRAREASGFNFVKIGLPDIWRRDELADEWFTASTHITHFARPVPVVYADLEARGGEFFDCAMAAVGLAGQKSSSLLVIDTFDKRAGSLLDHVSIPMLEDLTRAAELARTNLAFAGALDESAIEKLLPLAPAYIGVRGAACAGGRDGTIELARVKSLARLIGGAARKAVS